VDRKAGPLIWKRARMIKQKLSWCGVFVIVGAIAGGVFTCVLVRIPHWAGDNWFTDLIYAALLLFFTLRGGYLGERLYKSYGCGLGLHTWEGRRLPHTRECLACGRFQRPIDSLTEKSGWKDVRIVIDEVTGVISYEDLQPAST
jgi:hypothetical protein